MAVWTFLAFLAASAGGCANYNDRMAEVVDAYRAGRFPAAAEAVQDIKIHDNDRLVLLLERAKVFQDAGHFEASARVFNEADALIEEFEQKALVSATEEAARVAFGESSSAYRGTLPDPILASTYQAVNYLAMGDLEEALVHLRRATDRQQRALQARQRQIESREAERDKALARASVRNPMHQADGLTQRLMSQPEIARIQTGLSPAYAEYVNPLTEFLAGLLFTADGDVDEGKLRMRRAADINPGNELLEAEAGDYGLNELLAERTPVVYVIVERGMAPKREQTMVPLSLDGRVLQFIGLPSLAMTGPPVQPVRVAVDESAERSSLTADATGVSYLGSNSREPPRRWGDGNGSSQWQPAPEPEVVVDLRQVVATDFNDRLTQLIARVAANTVVDYAAQRAAVEEDNVVAQLGAIGWSLLKARPDLRTWRTIGADAVVTRVERPESGRMLIEAGLNSQVIELPPAWLTIVWCRSVGPGLTVTPIPVEVVGMPPFDPGATPTDHRQQVTDTTDTTDND